MRFLWPLAIAAAAWALLAALALAVGWVFFHAGALVVACGAWCGL